MARPGPRVFVAYPYTVDGRRIVSRIVRPALASEGIVAVRYPVSAGNCDIGVVRRKIEGSGALIGVVAGRSANVFFEIGLAVASGKPCLLVADRTDELGMLAAHADTVVLSAVGEKAADEAVAQWLGRTVRVVASGRPHKRGTVTSRARSA